MYKLMHQVGIVTLVLLLAACGKKQDAQAPLAFVPADTPYVFANTEPVPKAITDKWSSQMQQLWPMTFGMYSRMLDDAKEVDEPTRRVVRAILDEFKNRDSMDKWREIGLKPDALVAVYGIGLVPVLRLELADPAAFRATVARVEEKGGAKLATAKVGTQDYWLIGDSKVTGIIAVIDKHLVLSIAPKNASEELRKRLLGLTRPTKSLLEADTLSAFNRQHGYRPSGSGYADFVRIVETVTGEPDATQSEFHALLGIPQKSTDPVCRAEFLEIARKFPRFDMGYTELTPQRMVIHGLLEMEPALAGALVAAVGVAPGSGAKAEGMIDFSLALPVLKLKDFWLKQLTAAATKPYACSELAELNSSIADAKAKLATTIPPPASDLTGARFTLSRIDYSFGGEKKPDGNGKLLIGLTNPMSALAMGQMALPQLKDIKLMPDGKPVAMPTGMPDLPPLFAAMNDKALAISVGTGEEVGLGAFLDATPAKEAIFLRVAFTGEFYSMMGDFMQKAAASMPEATRAQLQEQGKMFALYRQWLRSAEITLAAKSTGVELRETIEMN